jgi:hypothetical protein
MVTYPIPPILFSKAELREARDQALLRVEEEYRRKRLQIQADYNQMLASCGYAPVRKEQVG